jgi:ABC-type tungstate transport system substrate-binding protein
MQSGWGEAHLGVVSAISMQSGWGEAAHLGIVSVTILTVGPFLGERGTAMVVLGRRRGRARQLPSQPEEACGAALRRM